MFYNKHQLVSDTSPQSADSPSNDDGTNVQDEWFEIDKVTSRRMINGKETFLVHWKDNTKTRELAENISECAKSQYFVNLRKNKNRRRRRQ